ncbi:MBG domain-containing protein [Aurantiacibacter flavus]|uniref:MBG domain-containing protein n=1 Tax=Aurantiacibacter flavus TaxID=3145232 RepID=A0ABV0D472_9SPHN
MTKSTFIAKSLRSAVLLASTAISTAAMANDLPTGGEVAAGSVTIGTPSAGSMAITQNSDRAVVNWTSFSVGEGNTVNIAQPNAQSALLNRVTSDATSVIAGQINANGQVFLINPNGIAITKTGTVNAAAFTASTLDISDRDFMAGRDAITVTAPANVEVMRLRAGLSDLMSPDLADGTLLVAGVAKMDGSDQAALDLTGDGFLRLGLPTGTIDVAGTINADTVVLTAGTARDAARGVVNMSGVINATGVDTKGGVVRLTGDVINLTGAQIDASGTLGGGSIEIGGGYQGTGDLAHATDLNVDAGTVIRADAIERGDGGDVVLWSDHKTAFAGTITARGGAAGGDGGDAEVSGKALLAYEGFTNLLAPKGKTGDLLLDPYNVKISVNADNNSSGFTATGDASVINVGTLTTALASANVTVSTGTGGSHDGNIAVESAINWNAATTLELRAANRIYVNAGITNSADNAGVILRADADGSGNGFVFFSIFPINGSINLSGANSTVDIYYNPTDNSYNPTDYTTPTDFSGSVTAGTFNAWMLVNTLQDLQDISINLSGNYALSKSIDASDTVNWNQGAGFDPIGENGTEFTGKLDGQSNAISNLTINRPDENIVGLFGFARDATIANVGLEGGAITGNGNVGGLVGASSNGTINNAYVTGSVSGGSSVGGSSVGGLVGAINNVTINNAYVTGSVSGGSFVGGLVGSVNNGTISNAYVTGSVSGGSSVGGLVGASSNGTISNAYVTGPVSGGSFVGGLIGNQISGAISNAYWDSYSTGIAAAFGNESGTSSNIVEVTSDPSQSGAGNYAFNQSAYAVFDFTNDWFMINGSTRPFGRWEHSSEITNSHQLQLMAMDLATSYTLGADIDLSATGAVTEGDPASYAGMWTSAGWSPVGDSLDPFTGIFIGQGHAISGLTINRPSTDYNALFGKTSDAWISNVGLNNVSITGRWRTGSLVGQAVQNTQISDVYASGAVEGTSPLLTVVGGLVGQIYDSSIDNAHANVAVTGETNIGGLVGQIVSNASYLTNSYATGSVSGQSTLGGLIGQQDGGNVANVYATGSVSGSADVGGLVGDQVGGYIFKAYWDSYSTGLTAAFGSEGGTNSDIVEVTSDPSQSGAGNYAFNQSTYAVFDFTNDWFMIDGSTRPFGRWEHSTEITNASELQLMVMDLTASYTLGADIDLSATGAATVGDPASYAGMWSSEGWWRIGDTAEPFTGEFNGQGHVISGLTIDHPTSDRIGLFGLANGGAITNVGLENVSIVGRSNFGGLVGLASDLEINNVYVTGSVSGGGYAGGLVGQSLGSTQISHSYSTATVAAGSVAGGLVGLMRNTSSVSNSYATGDVSGDLAIGGLVGAGAGSFTISNSYAAGKVTGNMEVGGLIGGGREGTVTNSYWDSFATTQDNALGKVEDTPITVTSTVTAVTSDPTESDAVNYALKASAWGNFQTTGSSDIDTVGGQDKVWRMYDGYTMPLLKTFMTRLDVTVSGSKTVTYNGQEQSLTPTLETPTGANAALVKGSSQTIRGTNAGTYTAASGFYSEQQGYDLVVSGSGGLTINPAELTVTYTAAAASRTYGDVIATSSGGYGSSGGGNGTLSGTYTASGAVNGEDITGLTTGTASWTSTADQTTGVGKYAITGGGISSNSANYTIKAVQAAANATALTINPAELTVTYTAAAASRSYGDANGTFSGTYEASGAVNGEDITGLTTGTASWTSTADQTTGVGNYAITGGGISSNSANYTVKAAQAAGNANALTITKRAITVTADDLSRSYGEANPALTYKVATGSLVNGDTLSGALATDATATSDVDTYVIDASALEAGGNYDLTVNNGTLTITKRAITVTADDLSRIYGDANPELTYKVTTGSLVNDDVLSGTLSTGADGASNVGSYVIDASALEAGGNYDLTVNNGTLTITKRALTVTYTAKGATSIYGDAPAEVTGEFKSDGLVNGDELTGAASWTTQATGTSSVGNYAITGAGLGASDNYTITAVQADANATALTITKRAITVTADDLSRIYGDANPELTYKVTTGSLVNDDTLSGTLSTGAGVASNVGSYVIDASTLEAGENYDLTFVDGTLVITPRSLTVTYTADSAKIDMGEDMPVLTGGVSSEGLVNGDELTGTANWSTTANADSQMGSYAITGSGIGASDNYELTEQQAEGNATALTIAQPAAPVRTGPTPDMTAGILVNSQAPQASMNVTANSGSQGRSLDSIETYCEDGSC